MSFNFKKAFETGFQPFAELSHSILNTYSFLDSSLTRLDEYIALKRYPFTAEEVLICIADDEWCEYGLEVNLYHDSVDNKYSRLHDAIDNPKFCETFPNCSEGYKPPFFDIRTSVALMEEFYTPFTVREMSARVKSTFELSHTQALSLVARAFGFKSGNELQQFDRVLKYSIFYLSKMVMYWVPAIDFCERVKIKYDDAYRNGVPSGFDREIAKGIFSGSDMKLLLSHIGDVFTRTERVEFVAKHFYGVEIIDIENWFYNQFARVVWGVEMDVDTVKKNIIHTALVNHLTLSMRVLYLSAFGSDVRPKVYPEDVSADEIQYHWIRTSVSGNQEFSNNSDIALIEELQELFNNTFVSNRVPHVLDFI